MVPGTTESSTLDAANALLGHLRRNPVDALRPPHELAAQFGMDPTFVGAVLEGVRLKEDVPVAKPRRFNWDRIRKFGANASELFDRMVANPGRFVIFTTLLAAVIFALVVKLGPAKMVVKESGISVKDGSLAAVVLILMATHMVCYFRRGMSRYPLAGGLIVWCVITSAFAIAITIGRIGSVQTTDQRTAYILMAALGFVILCGLYAAVGCLFAVAGGYVRARVSDRMDEQLSRQEVLERYFALQERLKQGVQGTAMEDRLLNSPVGAAFNRAPFLIGAAYMALATLVTMLTMTFSGITKGTVPDSASMLNVFILFVQLVVFTFSVLGYVGFGLFSKSALRAVMVSLVASFASTAVSWIPIGGFGLAAWLKEGNLPSTLAVSTFFAGVSLTAAVGADLQRKASRQRNLQRNDPATVLAEMVRIQLRLAQHGGSVCVLVVDAVKSAAMKANADPLAVEYSFREYQEWIEAVSEKYQGQVHSTAGDGAVVAFPNCELAFDAARMIQSDLARFNQEVNRLAHPFRLRVGLHVGQVVGNLDEVEFTEVIDIAAHLQDAAPIAGIAVTDDVAACLLEEQFIPLAEEIDGHRVLLALNPTLD